MSEEKFLTHYDVSASALTTERLRMRLIANNIANMNTTRTVEGGPYKRMEAVVQTKMLNKSKFDQGVSVTKVTLDQSPPRLVFDPAHPDANAQGYVGYPNIDMVREAANLKRATMAYDANATVLDAIKKTVDAALRIGG